MGHRAEKARLRHGFKSTLDEKRKHAVDTYHSERPRYVEKKGSKNKGRGYA